MLAVADAYSAAMMEGYPRGSTDRVQHGIQQRPIADGVRPVQQPFGFAVAGGHPTEGPLPLAEKRPNVTRHKSGEIEGLLHSGIKGALAEVIAVVEDLRAALAKRKHGLDVARHRLHRPLSVFLRVVAP